MQDYYRERSKVMNCRNICRNLGQVIGEHGVRLCELGQADKSQNKRALMSKWVDIHEINKEWGNLIACGEHPESEFAAMSRKLICNYSECLADYILDKQNTPEWKEKMTYIVNIQNKFFNALSKRANTKQQDYWIAYTGSIINMVNCLEKYGIDSEVYGDAAAHTIETAVLLGKSLDYCLRE
jgi:hypothetical protein